MGSSSLPSNSPHNTINRCETSSTTSPRAFPQSPSKTTYAIQAKSAHTSSITSTHTAHTQSTLAAELHSLRVSAVHSIPVQDGALLQLSTANRIALPTSVHEPARKLATEAHRANASELEVRPTILPLETCSEHLLSLAENAPHARVRLWVYCLRAK